MLSKKVRRRQLRDILGGTQDLCPIEARMLTKTMELLRERSEGRREPGPGQENSYQFPPG